MYHTLIRKPKSMAEFVFSVPWESLEPHIEREAGNVGKEMKLDGFRPGKVPADIVRQRLTDIEILKLSLDRIIARFYRDAVKHENLETLGKPEVSLAEIRESQPLKFTITTALVPRVVLPDTTTLTVEERPVVVTEEDVAQSLRELWNLKHLKTSPNAQPTEKLEEHKTAEADPSPSETSTQGPANPPDFSDREAWNAFAQSLGRFNSLDELRDALQRHLKEERSYEESVRLENALIELLISQSVFDEIPDILLESELQNVFHEFKNHIERHGVSFSHWLEQSQKTEGEIKESLKPAALKRAQSSLIIREFINREKLELTEEDVREEIAELMRQYPDPKQQEEFLKPSFIDYFQRVLLSKKAMKRLKEMMIKPSPSGERSVEERREDPEHQPKDSNPEA